MYLELLSKWRASLFIKTMHLWYSAGIDMNWSFARGERIWATKSSDARAMPKCTPVSRLVDRMPVHGSCNRLQPLGAVFTPQETKRVGQIDLNDCDMSMETSIYLDREAQSYYFSSSSCRRRYTLAIMAVYSTHIFRSYTPTTGHGAY